MVGGASFPGVAGVGLGCLLAIFCLLVRLPFVAPALVVARGLGGLVHPCVAESAAGPGNRGLLGRLKSGPIPFDDLCATGPAAPDTTPMAGAAKRAAGISPKVQNGDDHPGLDQDSSFSTAI